jgi:fermentation-respiration switch protein FrsA (DUF1100 family)
VVLAGLTAIEPRELVGLRPRRAILLVHGSADRTLPYDLTAAPFWAGLAAPSFLVRVEGGSHSGFSDVDASLPPAALARQQRIALRYATAFVLRHLAGQRRLATVLTAEDARAFGPDVTLAARPR